MRTRIALTATLGLLLTGAAAVSQPPAAKSGPTPAQAKLIALVKEAEQKRAELIAERTRLSADRRQVKSAADAAASAASTVAREQQSSRKWVCNAYGTEHDDPSQCDKPQEGGQWTTKESPGLPAARQRQQELGQRAADAAKLYDDEVKRFDAAAATFDAQMKSLNAALTKAGLGATPALAASDPAAVKEYATKAVARVWAKPAAAAAANLSTDADLRTELETAAKGAKHLKVADLRVITAIESGSNKGTGTNQFGYAGLFQMGKTAAKDVGADYAVIADPKNWKDNVAAGVKFMEKNAERLSKKGHEVSALNVYLSHQQGATGADRLLTAVKDGTATTKPANKNQLANLPKSYVKAITGAGGTVSAQNYYDYWSKAFTAVGETVNQPPDTPLP